MSREPRQISRQNAAGIRPQTELVQDGQQTFDVPSSSQADGGGEGSICRLLIRLKPLPQIQRSHDGTPVRGFQCAPSGTGMITPRAEAMSLSKPTRPYGPA